MWDQTVQRSHSCPPMELYINKQCLAIGNCHVELFKLNLPINTSWIMHAGVQPCLVW